MRKYLFLAVAALGFAACAEKGLDNGPVQNGELEQSYVAITLAADDMTTKADGQYEVGLDAEREVMSAYVFFFKDNEPFLVKFDGSTSTNEGPNNYLDVAPLAGNAQGMKNVSDIKDAVLVLQNYKGEYPNKILAVLNWTPTEATYSLPELKEIVDGIRTTDGFIMSNAVYANSNKKVVDAVALTVDNIAKNPADAKANPVTINVERVAAKVTFKVTPNTANGDVNDNNGKRFNIGKNVDGDIYAQILGYELYNANDQSYLLKRIDPTWAEETIGFPWNNVSWRRSYWANSYEPAEYPNNSFEWNNPNSDYSIDTPVYCGENTSANNTKVVVKAQLQRYGGAAVEIVNWYGKDYVGEDHLKAVVANTLKNKYFSSTDETNYIGLADTDLMCVLRGGDENAYEVYFRLSTAASGKIWYEYKNGTYEKIDNAAALNAKLDDIQPALVYKNGMTYYFMDIKHLGDEDSDAEFGVVRNHVYSINITDINGYGTPVYDPTYDFVTPEVPDPVTSYVAAQINILSWRVVANDYELK